MSIETRPNNAVAVVCDETGCHMEVLGIDETDAKEDANLTGWRFLEKGAKHKCPDCEAGRNPAGAAAFGVTEIDMGPTSVPVGVDDLIRHPLSGEIVGRAVTDFDPGERVRVVPLTPEQVDALDPQDAADAVPFKEQAQSTPPPSIAVQPGSALHDAGVEEIEVEVDVPEEYPEEPPTQPDHRIEVEDVDPEDDDFDFFNSTSWED